MNLLPSGAFVYRLGHGPLKAERRVRFPYALPICKTNPDAVLTRRANALRHSFISYRVAVTKDVPKVSLEAGDSPKMIDSNYRELVTDRAAHRWFSIAPGEEVNIHKSVYRPR